MQAGMSPLDFLKYTHDRAFCNCPWPSTSLFFVIIKFSAIHSVDGVTDTDEVAEEPQSQDYLMFGSETYIAGTHLFVLGNNHHLHLP